eukprot:SM000064S19743  [mRNA]  locus=s64:283304:284263:+ [translate_table: standard]
MAGRRRAAVDPASAALLVIDMQEHFRGIAEPILKPLAGYVAAARQVGMPVIHTKHLHSPESDGGRRSNMLREWWPQIIVEGSPDGELLPEVPRLPGDAVVRKDTYDAFYGTDLDRILQDHGVHEVVITGVMTNLCCETSARAAFVRGYRVFFAGDATATLSNEYHKATLRNIAYGFGTILTEGDFKTSLSPKAP